MKSPYRAELSMNNRRTYITLEDYTNRQKIERDCRDIIKYGHYEEFGNISKFRIYDSSGLLLMARQYITYVGYSSAIKEPF